MSEYDDAQDFATAVADLDEMTERLRSGEVPTSSASGKQSRADRIDEEISKRGQPTQYSLYGAGYTAATPTVQSLPPGIYDITADSKAVFVVPMAKPAGLLLELPEMRSEEVINIVERFWASEKDYKEGNEFVVGGAAFKAGIMVYGPPGTGKSCTLKIVANKLVERGGTVFHSNSSPHMAMAWLMSFARVEPDRKCIVILEDLDSLIINYGEAAYLEMLDSAKSIDNVLFIATTNYPDRLDQRIYNRPGRFSHIVKIGLPGAAARTAYLKAILKNHRDVDAIVKDTEGFTIDHLTALVNAVYREKKDLEKEIARLRTLFRVPKSDDEKTLGFK